MMRHEKLFNHHPISEEKILCRVLSSNWSIDITLLCRVNRRGTCVKLFMKGLKNFHLIPAGARRGHRGDQEDVEELQLEKMFCHLESKRECFVGVERSQYQEKMPLVPPDQKWRWSLVDLACLEKSLLLASIERRSDICIGGGRYCRFKIYLRPTHTFLSR